MLLSEEKLCENNSLLRSLDIAPTLYRADPQVTSGRQVSSLVIQIPSITTKWRLLEAQLTQIISEAAQAVRVLEIVDRELSGARLPRLQVGAAL